MTKMKNVLYAVLSLIILIALWALVFFPKQRAEAAGVVGTGTPASCTETALNTALMGGGAVTFDCGVGPVTILLSSQKVITQSTTIDGGGKITLNGADTTRLFSVSGGVSL